MDALNWEAPAEAQPAMVVKVQTAKARGKLMCAKCGERPRKRGQRWCRVCHAEYMREWRIKAHEELEHLREMAASVSR